MGSSALRSGWLPAVLVAIAAAVAALAYGTPPTSVAAFAAYLGLGLAVPGMLWVRLARGGARHVGEDLGLGLAVGYTVEILAYLPARAVGLPQLVLLWPAATLAAFALVPGLRRFWRGDGSRAPALWSWSLAGLAAFLVVFAAVGFYAGHPLTGSQRPYVDMPYHLALIGELRWHVMPDVPYVAGLPLAYHWFFYAEAAATSWTTGIDPLVLLYRLSVLPMLVAFVVLTACAARRLTGAWWPGPVAATIALLGRVATPYAGVPGSVFDTQTVLPTWISPTNALGLALFSGLLLVIIDILADERPVSRRRLVLAALLIVGASGAKATLLPLLIAGLLLVVVASRLVRGRFDRRALGLFGMAAVVAAAALVVVYRGSGGGLGLGLASVERMPIAQWIGVSTAHGVTALVLVLAVLGTALVLWSFLWAGAVGLLIDRRWTSTTPAILVLAGVCLAALGAAVLLRYPGLSELYYLRAASGAFGILAAVGIAALRPAGASGRVLLGAMAVAALIGALAVTLVGQGSTRLLHRVAGASTLHVLAGILAPIVALIAVAAVGALAARWIARRQPRLAGAAPLLVVALMLGFSLPPVAALVTVQPGTRASAGPLITEQGIAAAQWLRDHSSPDELVATNLHCLPTPSGTGACDARHFWVSAFSERRMLVEGWAYTVPAQAAAVAAGNPDLVNTPFWDPARLAANDAAFTAPTPAAVGRLRSMYGVTWLFADLATADAAGLSATATLRFQSGSYAVYQVRPG